ncbi:MAG: endonuclease III domain-containing protein, partial [Candidatus Puniceispirillaceae bacterium]
MATKPRTRKMKLAHIEECFVRMSARLPEPRTELEYKNPYTLLVAVVLSAQATDVGVNRATKGLYAAADTPQAMIALGKGGIVGAADGARTRRGGVVRGGGQLLELGVDGIAHHIRTIGLFNTKAKNVHKLSQILIDEHGGEVPADRAALEALPGVGRKTANVVLNEAFGEPTIAVDTHIFRVG